MSAARQAVGGPSGAALAKVEQQVRAALRGDRPATLRPLAWGEIGPVLGWPSGQPEFALKRLPPFAGREACDAFASVLDDYVAALGERGLECVPTAVRPVEGTVPVVAYVVQPLLPADCMGPEVLRGGDPQAGHPMLDAILEADLTIPGPLLALDGQLSNFAWVGDRLLYLDLTTPMLFDAEGELRMDMGLLLRALPAILRPAVRRWVVPDLMRRYRDPRSVVLDMLGNLLKERLDDWVHVAIEASAGRASPPLTFDEVRRSYRSDARLWEVLLRLRRLDRAWQQRIRRREYPFLLPGAIER